MSAKIIIIKWPNKQTKNAIRLTLHALLAFFWIKSVIDSQEKN